jgi:hypothetical protein
VWIGESQHASLAEVVDGFVWNSTQAFRLLGTLRQKRYESLGAFEELVAGIQMYSMW